MVSLISGKSSYKSRKRNYSVAVNNGLNFGFPINNFSFFFVVVIVARDDDNDHIDHD